MSILGIYVGIGDRIPIGALMNKGLTVRASRSHVQAYIKPWSQNLAKDEHMTDKVPTPVSGNPESKGAPDGVSGVADENNDHGVQGRSSSGESGGGAYPNPHTGKTEANSGFLKHGGQTENAYYGSGQLGETGGGGPNAVTGSGSDTHTIVSEDPEKDRKPRNVMAGDRSIAVVETSGIAEAEAVGKVAGMP